METGYKAFTASVIKSIQIEEDRFGFEPEIPPNSPEWAVGSTRWAFPRAVGLMQKAKRTTGETA